MIYPLSLLNPSGKKVIVRAGFDVPMTNGTVTDVTRILATVPTIRFILDGGGSVILLSHQGRPEGRQVEYSQAPLVSILRDALHTDVLFIDDCTSDEAQQAKAALQPGQVLLLENVRYYDAETTKNSVARLDFAQMLAQHADAFVNEAFTNAHRPHASVYELATLLPSYAGLQLESEYTHLQGIFTKPRPIVLIVAGAKLETKVPVIESFLGKGDCIIVGGVIANAFLAAQGCKIGASRVDADAIAVASRLLHEAEQKETTIRLPIDAICSDSLSGIATSECMFPLQEYDAVFDIGPKTRAVYIQDIMRANTIIWNGPVGVYEQERFSFGSQAIANAIIDRTAQGAQSIIGGGDTLDFWQKYHLPIERCTFASTGGGAMLEMISGATMPGISVLDRA
jgi:phosphoglycerate kinase